MLSEMANWQVPIDDSAASGDHMTTWEREIAEQRGAMDDCTPIVAAAWRNLDKSGKPFAGPTILWKQGDDKDGLNAFLRHWFDSGFGHTQGVPFVVWTEKCAYFSVRYDGAEWVGAVPLAPTKDFEPTHFGS